MTERKHTSTADLDMRDRFGLAPGEIQKAEPQYEEIAGFDDIPVESREISERVARALCKHHGLDPDELVLGHARWLGWARQAECAITAMRATDIGVGDKADTLMGKIGLLKEYVGPYGIETSAQAIDRCIAIVRDQSGERFGDKEAQTQGVEAIRPRIIDEVKKAKDSFLLSDAETFCVAHTAAVYAIDFALKYTKREIVALPDKWQQISTTPVPYDQAALVCTESGYVFPAKLIKNLSMTEEEKPCDTWMAALETFCPPCWTDDQCWESNSDGVMSEQPRYWRPLTTKIEVQESGDATAK